MEWLMDPTVLLGLLALIVLEIVLGIDNLVFIAILADKLPPHQRDRARQLGLGLALIMRLGLLASISWLVTLTNPWFSIFGHTFSGREIILFGGGLFLLIKATAELHERLEGDSHKDQRPKGHASFWVVVMQIIALDAVFSLDSVITAVGMVDHLAVMMIAVIIAMVVMILASKSLTEFVNARPTVVILCLSFLLMIGFSLMAEGLGFHIPKGYLYAAIGFSILIEVFNQLARSNRRRFLAGSLPLRARTAEAVLKIIGGEPSPENAELAEGLDRKKTEERVFDDNERTMIRSVLNLADRPVQNLMTPRPDVVWIDVDATAGDLLALLNQHAHTRLVVARKELDELVGVVQSRDLLMAALAGEPLNLAARAVDPLVLPEGTSSLNALEAMRHHPVPMALVVDEYGSVGGVITTNDLLAAIAGELVDTTDPETPLVVELESGHWLLDGSLPLADLEDLLGVSLDRENLSFYTLAGLAMDQLQHLPALDESFGLAGYQFRVHAMVGRRIQQLGVSRIPAPGLDSGQLPLPSIS